jgi:hypothetical protein
LNDAFAPTETEMRVNDVNVAEIRFNAQFKRRTIFPTKERWSPRQLDRSTQVERVTTKDGVAIVFIVSSHRRMKMAVPSELLGDHFSLISASGTSPTTVDLLQPDNIE